MRCKPGGNCVNAVKLSAHLVPDRFGDLIFEKADGLQSTKTLELCDGDEKDGIKT